MPETSFSLTEGRLDRMRLEMLVIDFGTSCLRRVCQRCWKEHHGSEWDKLTSGRVFINSLSKRAEGSIYPDLKTIILNGEIEKWDITALSQLISCLAIKEQKLSASERTMVSQISRSVENLNKARNRLMHQSKSELPKPLFESMWQQVRGLLIQILNQLGGSESEVDSVCKEILNARNEDVDALHLKREQQMQKQLDQAILVNRNLHDTWVSAADERRKSCEYTILKATTQEEEESAVKRTAADVKRFYPRITENAVYNIKLQQATAQQISKSVITPEHSELSEGSTRECSSSDDSQDEDDSEEEIVAVSSSRPSSESSASMQLLETFVMKKLSENFQSMFRDSRSYIKSEEAMSKLVNEFVAEGLLTLESSGQNKIPSMQILGQLVEAGWVGPEQKLRFWRITAKLAEDELGFMENVNKLAQDGLFLVDLAIQTLSHVTFLSMSKFAAEILSAVLRRFPDTRNALQSLGINLVVFGSEKLGILSMGPSVTVPTSCLQQMISLSDHCQKLTTSRDSLSGSAPCIKTTVLSKPVDMQHRPRNIDVDITAQSMIFDELSPSQFTTDQRNIYSGGYQEGATSSFVQISNLCSAQHQELREVLDELDQIVDDQHQQLEEVLDELDQTVNDQVFVSDHVRQADEVQRDCEVVFSRSESFEPFNVEKEDDEIFKSLFAEIKAKDENVVSSTALSSALKNYESRGHFRMVELLQNISQKQKESNVTFESFCAFVSAIPRSRGDRVKWAATLDLNSAFALYLKKGDIFDGLSELKSMSEQELKLHVCEACGKFSKKLPHIVFDAILNLRSKGDVSQIDVTLLETSQHRGESKREMHYSGSVNYESPEAILKKQDDEHSKGAQVPSEISETSYPFYKFLSVEEDDAEIVFDLYKKIVHVGVISSTQDLQILIHHLEKIYVQNLPPFDCWSSHGLPKNFKSFQDAASSKQDVSGTNEGAATIILQGRRTEFNRVVKILERICHDHGFIDFLSFKNTVQTNVSNVPGKSNWSRDTESLLSVFSQAANVGLMTSEHVGLLRRELEKLYLNQLPDLTCWKRDGACSDFESLKQAAELEKKQQLSEEYRIEIDSGLAQLNSYLEDWGAIVRTMDSHLQSSSIDFSIFKKIIEKRIPRMPGRVHWVRALELDCILAAYLKPGTLFDGQKGIKEMNKEDLRGACREFSERLSGHVLCAWAELSRSEFASAAEANSKFAMTEGAFKGKFASLGDFYRGPDALIGAPCPNVYSGMFKEHCLRANAKTLFTTPNYNVTTWPILEWHFVVSPESEVYYPHTPADKKLWIMPETWQPPQVVVWKGEHGRDVKNIDDFMEHPTTKQAELQRVEVIALRLYTGPMYTLYNAVLRRFPEEIVLKLMENNYETTIFTIASGITKLAKVTVIPANRLLFRGLGGVLLPDSFWKTFAECYVTVSIQELSSPSAQLRCASIDNARWKEIFVKASCVFCQIHLVDVSAQSEDLLKMKLTFQLSKFEFSKALQEKFCNAVVDELLPVKIKVLIEKLEDKPEDFKGGGRASVLHFSPVFVFVTCRL